MAQGVGKLLAPAAYLAALQRFNLVPPSALSSIATGWTISELVFGASLLVVGVARLPWPPMAWAGAVGALMLQVAYAVLTFSATARGLQIANCTCFGAFLPQRLTTWVIFQDLYMIGFSGWLLVRISAWPVRDRAARAQRPRA